jgi:hypothetical protein
MAANPGARAEIGGAALDQRGGEDHDLVDKI